MSTKLYHADVFIPAELRAKAEKSNFTPLIWSRHAQLEILNDRYGVLPRCCIPGTLRAALWTLVELETTGKHITKLVFRRPVDNARSLVVVIRPEDVLRFTGEATVCTAWTNLNSDKHNTLDRTKYEQANI